MIAFYAVIQVIQIVLQYLVKQIMHICIDFGGNQPNSTVSACTRYQTQSHHAVEKLVRYDCGIGGLPPKSSFIDCPPAILTRFVGSTDREWPDRRLPRSGEPLEKFKRGKLVNCIVSFSDAPEVREIYTNDWGAKFSIRNLWKSCYGERDRSRPHDPKAKSPGMTSLHVSEALCKAADLWREVIWESWDCDPELEQCDFGLLYPVRWLSLIHI